MALQRKRPMQQEAQAAKRCCRGPPVELQAVAGQQFLLRLQQASAASLDAACIDELVWLCFAELNLALGEGVTHQLPASPYLKAYHSLTRRDKAQLWGSFAEAHLPCTGVAGAQLPLHAQLVRVILQLVLPSDSQAALCSYTLAIPPGLHAWCSRWGYSRPAITLLAVEAFPSALQPGVAATPSHSLFIPVF